MPVGIQRLNAKKSHPNAQIVFIKPLPGPNEDVARDFLERIAAQCVPIMREHSLHVMTLEEHEPNAQFVGRNFNGGEVIQLVLKTRSTRRWLPFSYVQMVMMHELAHCREMNHSRAFWTVRDSFAASMRGLWARDYTGEGIWGRGARLGDAGQPAAFEQNTARLGDDDDVLMEHLCGGTFRSRRRRKRKPGAPPSLTWKEQEERRIKRKFGENGVAVGADVVERAKLVANHMPSKRSGSGNSSSSRGSSSSLSEQKRLAITPRVAVSKRGRELRAAAALARFEQNQKDNEAEAKAKAEEEERDGDSDGCDSKAVIKRDEEDDGDAWSDGDGQPDELTGPDAVDIDGTMMLDSQGQGMVRVCEDESSEYDSYVKRELEELLQSQKHDRAWRRLQMQQTQTLPKKEQLLQQKRPRQEPRQQQQQLLPMDGTSVRRPPRAALHDLARVARVKHEAKEEDDDERGSSTAVLSDTPLARSAQLASQCPVCSFANVPSAISCPMCSHVLNANVHGAWRCGSSACSNTGCGRIYVNPGDFGVCGLCGERKPPLQK